MRRGLIVGGIALICACGRTSFNEFDTVADQGESSAATVSESSAESSAETGAMIDLPDPDTTASTGDGDGDTGDGDGDPGDGDPGDGDPGDGDPGDGDPGDGDPTGGPMCGNGVVELGEQCDGADLGGFDCQSLGYDSGDLACDPMLCVYDASACEIDNGTSGGTTG